VDFPLKLCSPADNIGGGGWQFLEGPWFALDVNASRLHQREDVGVGRVVAVLDLVVAVLHKTKALKRERKERKKANFPSSSSPFPITYVFFLVQRLVDRGELITS
jgi:hypothetical protein